MKVEFTIDDIFGDSLNLKLDDEEEIVQAKEIENNKLIKIVENGVKILDKDLFEKVKKRICQQVWCLRLPSVLQTG